MRRIFTILAAVLMVGTFAFAQTAPQTQTKAPKAKTEKAAKTPTAHGAIVNSDATTLTLKTKAGEEKFAINSETKITQSGKAIMAGDLKAGETATVSYTKAGDQMTATKIVVAAAKPKAEKKVPKTEKK